LSGIYFETKGTGRKFSSSIKNKKNVDFNLESLQKDELITGALRDALIDENNLKKKAFKGDLLKSGSIIFIIMKRLFRVKGFSADIELSINISADLKEPDVHFNVTQLMVVLRSQNEFNNYNSSSHYFNEFITT
jgi:hypothetical protein